MDRAGAVRFTAGNGRIHHRCFSSWVRLDSGAWGLSIIASPVDGFMRWFGSEGTLLLLIGERFAEPLFRVGVVIEITIPIDEWIRRIPRVGAFAQLAVLVEEAPVRAEEDVGGEAVERLEAPLEVRPDPGVRLRLDERHEGQHRQAADAHREQVAVAVADGERPRRASRRVASG